MEFCNLVLKSKSKKSINGVLSFLQATKNLLKFNILNKCSKARNRKKVITILKSPHINKKAQEQLETRYFTRQIKLFPTQSFKHLVFLKKLKSSMSSGIKTKLKLIVSKSNIGKLRLKVFDPFNFNLGVFKCKTSQLGKRPAKSFFVNSHRDYLRVKLYVKVLEVYGELAKPNSPR